LIISNPLDGVRVGSYRQDYQKLIALKKPSMFRPGNNTAVDSSKYLLIVVAGDFWH
jgi:hypothetical protein